MVRQHLSPRQIENMVLQQNLHIVKTEERLQVLEEELGQFKKESWLTLATENQNSKDTITKLSEQIQQLQQQTSNLDLSTQSLESKQKQLTGLIEELKQLENSSQSLRDEPSTAEVHYQRGYSQHRLGNKQEALKDYSEAIRLDSKYAEAYHNRGILYAEFGRRKLAVADLRQASKLYFEQGSIDSYQKARDLGKDFYDLRDVMEEQVAINLQAEKHDSEENNTEKTRYKKIQSISVEHLFS